MKKDSLVFIKHIRDSIIDIEKFVKNVSKEEFLRNKEKQSATIKSLEVMGEAAKNLPQDFRNKHKEISWIDIVGMRDKLIHHYFGVDLEIVWKTINEDIPRLKREIVKILKS